MPSTRIKREAGGNVYSTITRNLVLEQLPGELRQKVATYLQPRWLNKGQQLAIGSEVFFPLGAVVSLIDTSSDDVTVEAGFVGYEGLLAIGPVRNIKAEVEVAGECLSLSRTIYEDFQNNSEFRAVTDGYRDRLLGLAFQRSVCLVSHRTEQRLATSLLAVMDRCGRDGLDLTQENLAARLGVTRPTVTIAAGLLQSRGLINHRYGHVRILDGPGLAEAACPCSPQIRAMVASS